MGPAPEAIGGLFYMKYSFDEKMRAIEFYEKKHCYNYPESCKSREQKRQYANNVKQWLSAYRVKGAEWLKRGNPSTLYSPEEKLSMIEPVLSGKASFGGLAKENGIRASTLFVWARKYRESGIDGLKCSKPGRPEKNMKDKTDEEKKTQVTDSDRISVMEEQIKDLEHRNLLLQAELDYVKKLRALVEKEERDGRERKRPSSENSSKARNTKGK